MDPTTARSILETISTVHPRIETSDRAVAVWSAALESTTNEEAGEALLVLLRESDRQPTPADILRVAREYRARRMPEPVHEDPRGRIMLQGAGKIIFDDIVAKMLASGKIVSPRKR